MEWRAERRTPGKVLSLRERPQRPLPGSGSASGVPFAATCAFAVLAAQAISRWAALWALAALMVRAYGHVGTPLHRGLAGQAAAHGRGGLWRAARMRLFPVSLSC